MSSITVILPCAGSGTRLGLPYPKEIHLVAQKTALIDLTFNRLIKSKDKIERVIVTLSEGKELLVKYLNKWRYDFLIEFIYFDDRNHEWPGSILSAERIFGDRNVIFLPDGFLVGVDEYPIIETMTSALVEYDIAFGYRPESDRAILKNLGGLVVEDGGSVSEFCDKPDMANPVAFNAFWACFGFKGSIGRPLLEMMMQSVRREPVSLDSVSSSVRAFPVEFYMDLGVWPNIQKFSEDLRHNQISPVPNN